ncbi:MAG: DNA-binding response regulator [Desulfobacteraceae bacterium]|nr:MAG: DNA-binding response regulator [Desulfobacteraceae bacterium]
MSSQSETVYIVEDDASFRKSLQRLIRSLGFESVAFESANSFLQADICYPGCVLLDVKLPDIDGLIVQKLLTEKGCLLPVIFMTGHGDIPMSVSAMKEGAVDFLPKPFGEEDLLCAINTAIDRNISDVQLQNEKKESNALIETLTPREKEVLTWIITGKLNKQIACEIGTTEKTIKVHRSRVFQKTRVSSVAELVRLAEKVNISPAS